MILKPLKGTKGNPPKKLLLDITIQRLQVQPLGKIITEKDLYFNTLKSMLLELSELNKRISCNATIVIVQ